MHLADAAAVDAVAKVIFLTVMIVLISLAWLVVGASLAPALRDPRRARVANVLLAGALVAATGLAVIR